MLPVAARDGYYAGLRADYRASSRPPGRRRCGGAGLAAAADRRGLLSAGRPAPARRRRRRRVLPPSGRRGRRGGHPDLRLLRRSARRAAVRALLLRQERRDAARGRRAPRGSSGARAVTVAPTDDERLRVREAPAARPVMRQIWRHLGFLHWPIDGGGARAAPARGSGGRHLRRRRLPGPRSIHHSALAHAAPPAADRARLSRGQPSHLRPPRRSRSGRLVLQPRRPSRLAVTGARAAYHLPYFHARMSLEAAGDDVAYRSRRLGDRSSRGVLGPVRPTGPAAACGYLDRWSSSWPSGTCSTPGTGARLSSARVHHAPYPLAAGGRLRRARDADRRPPACRRRRTAGARPLRPRGRRADLPTAPRLSRDGPPVAALARRSTASLTTTASTTTSTTPRTRRSPLRTARCAPAVEPTTLATAIGSDIRQTTLP